MYHPFFTLRLEEWTKFFLYQSEYAIEGGRLSGFEMLHSIFENCNKVIVKIEFATFAYH